MNLKLTHLPHQQTGEHITGSRVLFIVQSEPLLVEGAIKGKKIVQITSGQQHNVALDEDGYAYSWGFGGSSYFLCLCPLRPCELMKRVEQVSAASDSAHRSTRSRPP